MITHKHIIQLRFGMIVEFWRLPGTRGIVEAAVKTPFSIVVADALHRTFADSKRF
jgi:hypothetical protein